MNLVHSNVSKFKTYISFVIRRVVTRRPANTNIWLPITVVVAPTNGGGISPVVTRVRVVKSAIVWTVGAILVYEKERVEGSLKG
jgi:hypothetical protein